MQVRQRRPQETEHFKEVPSHIVEPENPIPSEEDSEFEFSELIEGIAVNEPTLNEVKKLSC